MVVAILPTLERTPPAATCRSTSTTCSAGAAWSRCAFQCRHSISALPAVSNAGRRNHSSGIFVALRSSAATGGERMAPGLGPSASERSRSKRYQTPSDLTYGGTICQSRLHMVQRSFWISAIEALWRQNSIVRLSGVRRAGKTVLCHRSPAEPDSRRPLGGGVRVGRARAG